MSLARGLAIGSVCLLALVGCREEPECNERNVAGRMEVVVECSTGKVPVCGTTVEEVYNSSTGALLPTPSAELSADGSCPAGVGMCRPRPVCPGAGQKATCANGETAVCVLGAVREIDPTAPTPDAGPPADDAGPGDTDAGPGDTDAGPETDAGAGDTDAGPETDAGAATDGG